MLRELEERGGTHISRRHEKKRTIMRAEPGVLSNKKGVWGKGLNRPGWKKRKGKRRMDSGWLEYGGKKKERVP